MTADGSDGRASTDIEGGEHAERGTTPRCRRAHIGRQKGGRLTALIGMARSNTQHALPARIIRAVSTSRDAYLWNGQGCDDAGTWLFLEHVIS